MRSHVLLRAAHGNNAMTQRGFPVTTSVPSADAIRMRILPKYRLRQPVTCRFLVRGLNDTYTVRDATATYYMRVYRQGWRRKSEIEAEVDMLNYLARHDQPVSKPIRRKDGTYLTRIAAPEGTRYAVLFTEAPGQPPRFNDAECRKYGEIAAHIHAVLDRRTEDTRRPSLDLPQLIDGPLAHITPFLEHRPDDLEYLRDVGTALTSEIDGLLPKRAPEYGCCHGDHHGGNVHQDPRGRMVVFDFDYCGHGWRAYDAAVFLWALNGDYSQDRKDKAKTSRRWNAFLDGYSKVRTFTDDELKAAKLFVPVRRIWWMGMHMTRTVETFGDAFVQDRWFDRNIGLVRKAME